MITWGCDGCGDVSSGAASDGSVSDGTVSGKTDGGTAGGACVGTGAGCAGAVVSRGALPEDWLDFLLSVPGRSYQITGMPAYTFSNSSFALS